ncbi:MAG: pyridoxal phosphate-dependent aminotransferase [Deltaproteobacteria bacterium DG_8]|nr:MAG: pyridoxal phosphate-dependent aminotransferase [Deltaproteobacteria bacterium DG_8]
MRKNFLIFGSPKIEQEEIDEVVDSLRSGWISTGPKVAKFEALFKDYIGSKHALSLNSCTAGLHVSMIVAGLKPNDEVITTPMTFAATGNSIIHSGAKPVFVDINLPTMDIDPDKIEEKITPRTKAILPVHFAGRPCQMKKIKEIAEKHHLLLIEDAAHALEATYLGQKIGTIGDLTVFSFYVTKNLVTGEGGMITTNNDTYAEKIQIYALHGMSKGAWKRYSDEGFKHYHIIYPGFKYNMMDLQAALGIHQLQRIEKYLMRREQIWQHYDGAFKNLPLETPPPPEENTKHARHLYTILLRLEELKTDRDTIQQSIYQENIGTGIHFISLHLHPYYQKTFGYKRDDFPNATYVSERTISLPLSAKLTDEDVNDVVKAVTKVLKKYQK